MASSAAGRRFAPSASIPSKRRVLCTLGFAEPSRALDVFRWASPKPETRPREFHFNEVEALVLLAPDAWVPLAEVMRPHGVQGELRLRLFNRDSDLLLDVEEVLVRFPEGDEQEVSVDAARRANDAILIKLHINVTSTCIATWAGFASAFTQATDRSVLVRRNCQKQQQQQRQ